MDTIQGCVKWVVSKVYCVQCAVWILYGFIVCSVDIILCFVQCAVWMLYCVQCEVWIMCSLQCALWIQYCVQCKLWIWCSVQFTVWILYCDQFAVCILCSVPFALWLLYIQFLQSISSNSGPEASTRPEICLPSWVQGSGNPFFFANVNLHKQD